MSEFTSAIRLLLPNSEERLIAPVAKLRRFIIRPASEHQQRLAHDALIFLIHVTLSISVRVRTTIALALGYYHAWT